MPELPAKRRRARAAAPRGAAAPGPKPAPKTAPGAPPTPKPGPKPKPKPKPKPRPKSRSGRQPASRAKAAPARARRRLALFGRAPLTLQAAIVVALLMASGVALNAAYHVVRKPSELFFPVSNAFYKTPAETWRDYAPVFRAHSTAVIAPELLAALAQVEASGNPVVRTYWRWSLSADPFNIYRPASSAVGMFQITDGTFEEARRYCIRDHAVAEEGAWNDAGSCWFNSLYLRVLPGHATELTSAYLDRQVSRILARHGIARAPLAKKQELATLIHLCGAGAGNAFARRGLRLHAGQRCGDHDARGYLNRVAGMQRVFARLAARPPPSAPADPG